MEGTVIYIKYCKFSNERRYKLIPCVPTGYNNHR